MYTGPKISKDGLVLALDAGNIKSFRGEPTNNILYTNGNINWSIGNLTAVVALTTIITNSTYRITCTSTGSFRFYLILSALTNGATYTMSYKYKFISGSVFSMSDWNDTSLSNVVNHDYGIYKYSSASGTRATYDSSYRFMDFAINTGVIVEIWDIQVERKNHATPFVVGTRGSTVDTGGGIIDISNMHRDVTINNIATYINNGSWTFPNLTGQTFTGSGGSGTFANGVTLEVWLKPTTGGSQGIFEKVSSGTGENRIYLVNNTMTFQPKGYAEGTFNCSSSFSSSIWQLVTLVYYDNGGLGKIEWYKNGTFTNTSDDDQAYNYGNISNTFYLGSVQSETYKYNGDIAIVRQYNRKLQASEILQNFNAHKSRFGL